MKTQTIEDMVKQGASAEEAVLVQELFSVLRPGMKIKANGRVETTYGDKTPLGLYRVIKRICDPN